MKKILGKFLRKVSNDGLLSALQATRRYLQSDATEGIGRFAFSETGDIRQDIQCKFGFDGDLLEAFVTNQTNIVHKWHHYIPIYDRYFQRFRNQPARFLEIGVSKGGSLQLWRKYFGQEAIIFGVDIDAECERYDGLAGQVRIGSQADATFLSRVVEEMGGIDIVLDDGSHRMDHISVALKALFPHLSDGGIYLIEDLQAAYWAGCGGGYKSRANFFNAVRDVIDDMHHWYHRERLKMPEVSGCCTAIHVHDSIVVLEKNKVYEPTHSRVPRLMMEPR